MRPSKIISLLLIVAVLIAGTSLLLRNTSKNDGIKSADSPVSTGDNARVIPSSVYNCPQEGPLSNDGNGSSYPNRFRYFWGKSSGDDERRPNDCTEEGSSKISSKGILYVDLGPDTWVKIDEYTAKCAPGSVVGWEDRWISVSQDGRYIIQESVCGEEAYQSKFDLIERKEISRVSL